MSDVQILGLVLVPLLLVLVAAVGLYLETRRSRGR